MTRAAFEAAWPIFVEVQKELVVIHDVDHPMRVAFCAELRVELDKLNLPKGKLKALQCESEISRVRRLLDKYVPGTVERILEPRSKIADAHYDSLQAKKNAVEALLEAAAKDAEVRSAETPLLYYTANSGTWNSQGFAAMQYAKGNAEALAVEVAVHGIRTDIRKVNEHRSGGRWSIDHADFEVWVYVEREIDIAILRRKPGLPLREWVRQCWARGVNPRVYNPYLPVGFEEKNGIGYQGQDLQMEKE